MTIQASRRGEHELPRLTDTAQTLRIQKTVSNQDRRLSQLPIQFSSGLQ